MADYPTEILWLCIYEFKGGTHLIVIRGVTDPVIIRQHAQQLNPHMRILDSFHGKPGLRPARDVAEIDEVKQQLLENDPFHEPIDSFDKLVMNADEATEFNATNTFDRNK